MNKRWIQRLPATFCRSRRAGLRIAATMLVGVVVLGGGLRLLMPRLLPFPEANLAKRDSSQIVLDAEGRVLTAETGWNDCWQLPVGLADISPHLIEATLVVEDRRFYEHGAVDWRAVLLAFLGNLRAGRIVSGASTISMQLARLAAPPEARSWRRKWKQVWRAYDLESRHSKDWILEQYFNHAPYGGNLIGAEAASRYYFGKPAKFLTAAEGALLAGLPQSPSRLRPDRHPENTRQRQARVIQRLAFCGLDFPENLAAESALQRAHTLPNLPPPKKTSRLGLPRIEPQFCQLAAANTPHRVVKTTLDSQLQSLVRTALQNRIAVLDGVRNGAVVVLEVKSGAVRALLGSPDFEALPSGQFNSATAARSPGSTLKPFIYLLAMERGMMIPETRLDGGPLTHSEYTPGNFDGKFVESPTVCDALRDSLNTPAVRTLQRVTVEALLEHLSRCGIQTLTRGAETYGLALAIGGGEVSLLELVNAYASLARGGYYHPYTFFADSATPVSPTNKSRVAASGAVHLVNSILTRPCPGLSQRIPVAWKTGTSNGFRDAWCIAYNQEWVIGVWLGNNEGQSSRALVGCQAAAPLIADLFGIVYKGKIAPMFPQKTDQSFLRAPVCRATGLRAQHNCSDTCEIELPADIPLAVCPRHHRENPSQTVLNPVRGKLQILSPEPGVYVATDRSLRLKLQLRKPRSCVWFVDGIHVETSAEPVFRHFPVGRHRISASTPDGRQSAQLTIEVQALATASKTGDDG